MKLFNVILSALFCFIVAFLPYIQAASGSGVDWIISVWKALSLGIDLPEERLAEIFYISIAGFLIGVTCVVLLVTKITKWSEFSVLLGSLISFAATILFGVWILRDIPVISIGMIPLIFSVFSSFNSKTKRQVSGN